MPPVELAFAFGQGESFTTFAYDDVRATLEPGNFGHCIVPRLKYTQGRPEAKVVEV